MTAPSLSTSSPPSPLARAVPAPILDLVRGALNALDRLPYALLALPLRLAVATVFWESALTHLANWQTTLYLFAHDYRLPFLPPHPAAYIAVTIEVAAPILLVLGFFTRPAAAVLLGMTAVIEIFIYPQAWPTHIQWAAMLLILLARGAGFFSLDELARRYLLGDK